MSESTILWRRLDHPGHEFARLTRAGEHWRLSGSALPTAARSGRSCA